MSELATATTAEPAAGGSVKADWSKTNLDFLLDVLVAEIRNGGRMNDGAAFKAAAWLRIRSEFVHY